MTSISSRKPVFRGLSFSRSQPQRSVKSPRRPLGRRDIGVPSSFGNAGNYWEYTYQALESENKNIVEGIIDDLDLILVFGALFAAVNAGFLTLVVPDLNPDPIAETNHLIALLLTHGVGQLNTSDSQLKPPEFTPSNKAIRLSQFFSISLSLTLLSSFGAMFVKQWMLNHNKRSRGGPSEAQCRSMQRELAAVRRYDVILKTVVEGVLPSLLQISLIIFFLGFIGYLETINPKAARTNAIIAWVALAVVGVTVIPAVWDPSCPFKTPISRFILFIGSFVFNEIPGIIVAVVKRFPKKLIKKATGGLFWSLASGWRHPFKTSKEMKHIITNIVDASYIRTLSHRFKSDLFSEAVSHIRRQEDPTDVMDAKYSCHMLRRMEQPEILRAVAQSIPTLFQRKAMSTLLKDKAVIRLHRLFRASIAQAEDDPNAPVQGSHDKSNPAVNAVIYGRAIIHLFIALGPHDDWFWDDYETALHHGWLEPWTLEGVDEVPDKVIVELEQQRLIIQACLSIRPDGNSASVQVEESALPLYIAANIKALLHRRVHYHLCHYPPKFRPTVERWTGEGDLERVAFCTVFPEDYPKTIGLVAWALATVPYRVYDRGMPILEKYNMFWKDLEELWDAYSSASNILRNVAKALEAYPLSTSRPSDENHLSTTELKTTYKAMLEAARKYIKDRATKEDVLATGPELVHAIRGLWAKMERVRYLSEEDEDIKALLQPIVDAIVVRRGRRFRQHVRSLSRSVVEDKPTPPLEKGWFSGNTPAALEDYSEWITTHRSSSPDVEHRDLFLSTWNSQRGPKEKRVDLVPSEDDGDEERGGR